MTYATRDAEYGSRAWLPWAAHTASGVWSAFSSRSGNKSSTKWTDVLAVTAAPVFSVRLLLLLSFGIYRLGAKESAVGKCSGQVQTMLKPASRASSAAITPSGAPQATTRMSLCDYAAAGWRRAKRCDCAKLRPFFAACRQVGSCLCPVGPVRLG